MLSWLDSFFSRVRGAIGSAVSDAIHYAVHALAAVVFAVFGLVGRAWSALVGAVRSFHAQLDRFAQEIINFATYVVKVLVPGVVAWVKTEITRLETALAQAAHDLATWVNDLIGRIAAAAADVIQWVLANVWAPVQAAIGLLTANLEKWGYTAWYYITHPDQLAELLINSIVTSLETHSWDIAKRLGQFTLALIAQNIPRLLQLIEDILTAVI
jgi:hypothetical protein